MPNNAIYDIIKTGRKRKDLQKFMSNLIAEADELRAEGQSLTHSFNHLFIEQMPEDPSHDLLYSLKFLSEMEPSKFSRELYTAAQHNAAMALINKPGKPKLTIEAIWQNPKSFEFFKFYLNQIDAELRCEIAVHPQDAQQLEMAKNLSGEFRTRVEELKRNEYDIHACINTFITFAGFLNDHFRAVTPQQLQQGLALYQQDLADLPLPDLTSFSIISAACKTMQTKNGKTVPDDILLGIESFKSLLGARAESEVVIKADDKVRWLAQTKHFIEKDFIPNDPKIIALAEAIRDIEKYAHDHRHSSHITRDVADNVAASLKEAARKFFSGSVKNAKAVKAFKEEVSAHIHLVFNQPDFVANRRWHELTNQIEVIAASITPTPVDSNIDTKKAKFIPQTPKVKNTAVLVADKQHSDFRPKKKPIAIALREHLHALQNNQENPHGCINVFLNFGEFLTERFPRLHGRELREELAAFQKDFADHEITNWLGFETVSNACQKYTAIAKSKDELQVINEIQLGLDSFHALLGPDQIQVGTVTAADKKSWHKQTEQVMETDFLLNAEPRKKFLRNISRMEKYGLEKSKTNQPKSEAIFILAKGFKEVARQYFAMPVKGEAEINHFREQLTTQTLNAKQTFDFDSTPQWRKILRGLTKAAKMLVQGGLTMVAESLFQIYKTGRYTIFSGEERGADLVNEAKQIADAIPRQQKNLKN